MNTTLKINYQRQAKYNRTANAQMLQCLSDLSEERITKNTGSYFGSVFGILDHIIICDMFWIKRFQPLLPESEIPKGKIINHPNLSFAHHLFDSYNRLVEHRRKVDDKIVDWFDEYPEDKFDQRFRYLDSAGTMHDTNALDAFNFLFTHQIHHRGQISQILDGWDVDNNFASNHLFLGD